MAGGGGWHRGVGAIRDGCGDDGADASREGDARDGFGGIRPCRDGLHRGAGREWRAHQPGGDLGDGVGGRFPWREVPGYVASQLLGAVAGSLAVRAVVGNGGCLGATVPSGGWLQSLGLEWLFTFLLFLAAWRVSGRPLAGVVVGSVVAMEAMVGGPISGASMNPARSLGPAVVSGCWVGHWVYWVGPVLGAACAAWLVRRPWFHDGEGNGNEAG